MLQIKFDNDRPACLRDIHVWKCGLTDGRRLESHTISSSWAFGSGELTILYLSVNFEWNWCIPSKFIDWKPKVWQRERQQRGGQRCVCHAFHLTQQCIQRWLGNSLGFIPVGSETKFKHWVYVSLLGTVSQYNIYHIQPNKCTAFFRILETIFTAKKHLWWPLS